MTSDAIRKYMAAMAKRRAKSLTAARRREIARLGGLAKAAKAKS